MQKFLEKIGAFEALEMLEKFKRENPELVEMIEDDLDPAAAVGGDPSQPLSGGEEQEP